MKPTIKEFQERIYFEIAEVYGSINWVSFYDTDEEYECQFDLTLEEIEEARELVAKRNQNDYDWVEWKNKVIENHYDDIVSYRLNGGKEVMT